MSGSPSYSPHQLAFFAHQLTRRAEANSMDRMAGALLDAQVDLNPHQIDAALFATSNPLSKGAILADEVGLGKTIEAGLLIAQRWAERKRRILIVTPANLRKQWYQELADKFGIPALIMEAKAYRQATKKGNANPLDLGGNGAGVLICSYQFAAGKAKNVQAVPWDLVVIDEAHRLRNVYKPDNKTANTLKEALHAAPKVLLTATPLQNSLLELYGLVSFIDEKVFGDVDSFKVQFGQITRDASSFDALKHRIAPICKRTLRRQVEAYVKYTRRIPMVEHFTPGREETQLYDMVSDYLTRPTLYALPNSQRQLITLVLRKLLASSTFAIAGALETLVKRLRETLDEKLGNTDLAEELDHDYEAFDELADEIGLDEDGSPRAKSESEIQAIRYEIDELESFRELAVSITENAKGTALLQALKVAFAKLEELGAAKKALIFTESRRTQDYLLRLLADTPYAPGVVLFNGSNSDERSKQIYNAWIKKHAGTDRVSGSRTADTRAALVDHFREFNGEGGSLMIATEAGAEGINLQFCSMIINYDLPWNPQRIEQRIGRCHRYGQKHDVVVVNFLNSENEADKRVFQLLEQKFQLFDGVFGASDEVLGAVESGVDFERRIAEIYQTCRHPTDIHSAFERLQEDLAGEINEAMLSARKALLENFDEEVQERLKLRDRDARASLGRLEKQLLRFTQGCLGDHASFDEDGTGFQLNRLPAAISAIAHETIPLGRYELPRRSEEAHIYRLQNPLAQALIQHAKNQPRPPARLTLRYVDYGAHVAVIKQLIGRSGVLVVSLLSVESLGNKEDHLLLAALDDTNTLHEQDVTEKLLQIPATVKHLPPQSGAPLGDLALPGLEQAEQNALDFNAPRIAVLAELELAITRQRAAVLMDLESRNLSAFQQETEKLDTWADDLKVGLEREIKELDRKIKEARSLSKGAATLAEKLAAQKEQREIEGLRDRKRRELFDRQDEIQSRRDSLIDELEKQLEQRITSTLLTVVEWEVV